MNRLNKVSAGVLCLALFNTVSASAGSLPPAWKHEQAFAVSTNGLVKITLPPETLDAARPTLEDLRLYDDLSNEIAYVIERPTPKPKTIQTPRVFQVALNSDNTVITLETDGSEPVDTVTLETPAAGFIKGVGVETSADGSRWQTLAQGQPIFRQSTGASQLQVSFPATVSKWLRLTVDDHRTPSIPFTGALIHAAIAKIVPEESMPATILARDESPGETRLSLGLGAANLRIASVHVDTADPLFMRKVLVAFPMISNDLVSEQAVGQGAIYRVALDGHTASENLSVPVENLVASRELILFIENGDSPPLAIGGVSVERRAVNMIFLARHEGTYFLLTGNPHCAAPRYDLAAMGLTLDGMAALPIKITALTNNPDYRTTEALPGLDLTGSGLDVTDWAYRKPVKISGSGAQQVELDLDVLAHAQANLSDLRVLSGSNQVPYIVQRTSINRSLMPTVLATNGANNPGSSRWVIQLARSSLPISRLVCVVSTPLFDRNMFLYEELTDERGEKYRHDIASARWIQTPEVRSREFTLTPAAALQSDTLYLETENGDNPAIALDKVTALYPAIRILFKAVSDDGMFLYYGNAQALQPRYDLNLVAGELLTAERKPGSLSSEERLGKNSWRGTAAPGTGGVLFWGILGLVVVALLVIISRLLPKPRLPAS